MRACLLVVVLLLAVTGCSSSTSPTRPAAEVSGHAISWAELQHNVTYALHFFSWAHTAEAPSSKSRCSVRSTVGWCRRLRDQVLGRLIEEQVVLAWARAHRVALPIKDTYRVAEEASSIASDPRTSDVLAMGVSRQFLTTVLTREMMVRRVEDVVSPRVARSGPSVHVTKYLIPRLSGRLGKTIYRQAVDLATDGHPIPLGARVDTSWVANFRLTAPERAAIAAAAPKDFVGPFDGRGDYLVMQVLDRAQHRYGTPARTELETRYFRPWLRQALRRVHITCYQPGGAVVPCPTQSIKGA